MDAYGSVGPYSKVTYSSHACPVNSQVATLKPSRVDFPLASCSRVLCPQNTFEALCPDFRSKATSSAWSLTGTLSLVHRIFQTTKPPTAAFCNCRCTQGPLPSPCVLVAFFPCHSRVRCADGKDAGSCCNDRTIVSQLRALLSVQRADLRGESVL